MKNLITLSLVLALVGSSPVSAQMDEVLATCKTGKWIFTTTQGKSGIVYAFTDTTSQKTTTRAIDMMYADMSKCMCNDSFVTVYVNIFQLPSIHQFQLFENEWRDIEVNYFPEIFPMVGMLRDGERYENNLYELIDIDRVVCQRTILKANDGILAPIEKYVIEYKIIPGILGAVMDKKTLIKE